MKWPALILAVVATTASARSDTDYPHRDWGQVMTLDMTVADATACIARELGRRADAIVIPVDSGNDIDVAPHTWPKSGPWQSYKVRSVGGATLLRSFYRHPVKSKAIDKEVAKLRSQCLRVSHVDRG